MNSRAIVGTSCGDKTTPAAVTVSVLDVDCPNLRLYAVLAISQAAFRASSIGCQMVMFIDVKCVAAVELFSPRVMVSVFVLIAET